MSMLCDRCRFTVLFAMTAAVVLLQCMGVGGYGWPISSSVSLMIFASFAFKKIVPNSASAADAATNLRIVQSVRIGPFRKMGRLLSGSQTRKKWPAARLLASFAERYNALECTFNIISDG